MTVDAMIKRPRIAFVGAGGNAGPANAELLNVARGRRG
jgi:hypothetical protein